MARRPLNPWVADFVRIEIESVLAWTNRKKDKGYIKLEDDHRFSDDGSNFRNTIASPEPGKDQVQLIQVLSSGNAVIVALSDGQTCIKGRLSDNAVETFEAALGEGEQLDLDVTGDVIRLKSFTLVTTAFGPEEDYIQLTIDDIDYCHHLRKTVGDPVSIEKDSRIRPLIERVIKSLIPADSAEEWEAEDERALSQVGCVGIGTQVSIDVPRSSPPVEPQSQLPIVGKGAHPDPKLGNTSTSRAATLGGQKRSAAQAGLEEDGFEMQSGVNLERPILAARNPDNIVRTNKLLKGLLINPQVEPQKIAESPARATAQPSSEDQRLRESQIAQQARQAVVNQAAPIHVSQRTRDGSPDLPTQTHIPSSPPVHSERMLGSGAGPAARNEHESIPSLNSQRGRLHIPYGRLQVPANQKKLLDLPTSWLPSLPGQAFPKPNIPIDLLKVWNTPPAAPREATPLENVAVPSRKRSTTPTQLKLRPASPQQSPAETSDRDRYSPTLPSNSSDSDDDIPASQWPSSQPEKPDRPPDSSLGGVIRSTPDDREGTQRAGTPDDLEVSPPKVAPVKGPPPTGPAALRIPLPARPGVPPPPSPNPARPVHHAAPSQISAWPPKDIPIGPRNSSVSHFRDGSSRGGRVAAVARAVPSQQSVDRSALSALEKAAKAVRAQSAEEHDPSDMRPPFEKTLGSLSRSTSQASTSGSMPQNPPVAGRVVIQQPVHRPSHPVQRHFTATNDLSPKAHSPALSDMRPPAERLKQSMSRSTSSASSSLVDHTPPQSPSGYSAARGSLHLSQRSSLDVTSRPSPQQTASRAGSQGAVQTPSPNPAGRAPSTTSDGRHAHQAAQLSSHKRIKRVPPPNSSPHSASSDGPSQIPAIHSSSQHEPIEASRLGYMQRPPPKERKPRHDRQSKSSNDPTAPMGTHTPLHNPDRRPPQPEQRTIPAGSRPQQAKSSASQAHNPTPRLSQSSPTANRSTPQAVSRPMSPPPAASRRQAEITSHKSHQPPHNPASAFHDQPRLPPNQSSPAQSRYPSFPVRHPTNWIEPRELNRRHRQRHRESHQTPIRQSRPAAGGAESTNPPPAASPATTSALPNSADRFSRTPSATQQLQRRHTGFTGVSSSPANQRRLAAAANGADAAKNSGGGRAEAQRGSRTSMMRSVRPSEARRSDEETHSDEDYEMRNRMKEFYECYRQLAPGGAFARRTAGGSRGSAQRRRMKVDVLQWDL